MTENTFTQTEKKRDHEDAHPHTSLLFRATNTTCRWGGTVHVCASHMLTCMCVIITACSVKMTGSREGKILDSFVLSARRSRTYRHSGDGGDEWVDDNGRRLAVVLRSWVRLGVSFVKTEESLDVHWERVRVLKVVCQQNGPCHDDQLEIKHIGSSFRIESTGECRSWERRDSRREQGGKNIVTDDEK